MENTIIQLRVANIVAEEAATAAKIAFEKAEITAYQTKSAYETAIREKAEIDKIIQAESSFGKQK